MSGDDAKSTLWTQDPHFAEIDGVEYFPKSV
jgi:hypothetical protein